MQPEGPAVTEAPAGRHAEPPRASAPEQPQLDLPYDQEADQ
jgi:hypothetical protein